MKYCTKCGNEVFDESIVCPRCSCALDDRNAKNAVGQKTCEDKVSGILVLLSVLFPIVGIILWPVKHKTAPKSAMIYGIVGIVSWIVCGIIISLSLL